MKLLLDDASYRAGWDDGSSGRSSKSQKELTLTGLDEWSYLSGFIEGEARRMTNLNQAGVE